MLEDDSPSITTATDRSRLSCTRRMYSFVWEQCGHVQPGDINVILHEQSNIHVCYHEIITIGVALPPAATIEVRSPLPIFHITTRRARYGVDSG